MCCERAESILLTQLTVAVAKSPCGKLHVAVNRGCFQALKCEDIMHVQHIVEQVFFELLAALPDDACPRGEWVRGK